MLHITISEVFVYNPYKINYIITGGLVLHGLSIMTPAPRRKVCTLGQYNITGENMSNDVKMKAKKKHTNYEI